jgi:DNA topoisomerase-1
MQPIHKPEPTGVVCMQCGEGEMMGRRSRRGKLFYSCSRYPECQAVAWDRPVSGPCPRCGAAYVTEKVTKRYGTVRRCVKEKCGWQAQVDTGNGAEYAPLPERRAAAQVRGRRSPASGRAAKPTAARRRSSRRASSS